MPFTAGNIVVYRVGTPGGAALGQDAVAVFLDEYTPAGVLVQSIALPTADNGAHQMLTARGVASGAQASEGHLNLSVDGRYLILTGYDAAPGTTGVASTSTNIGPSPVVRVIGRVSGQGEVDTTTTVLGFSGGQIRGAASLDGSSFWAVGATTGVVYQPFGQTDAGDIVSNGITNIRSIEIRQGELYVGSGSSSVRVGTVGPVGTGLATTPNNTIITLPGIPNGVLANQFVLLDRDGMAGVDTLYVADESAGIRKYSFDGTTWTARGVAGTGFFGLEGEVFSTGVVLYATSTGTNGNVLTTFTDTAAYDANISGSFTTIAVAQGNSGFRGVAFAPLGFQLGIGFAASEYSVVEGDAGTSLLTVVVERLFNGIGEIFFSGTIAAGDTTDADFVNGGFTSFIGSIDVGQSTGTFTIAVQGDIDLEKFAEEFTLTLTSATAAGGGTVLIPTDTASATGVIVDDDGFAAVLELATMTSSVGFRMTGAAGGDGAGTAVAGPGDIDGDGLDDFLVGAPYFDGDQAANGGAVYVLGGKAGPTVDLDLGALDEADGLDVRAAFADQNLGLNVGPGFDKAYYGPNDSTRAYNTWTIVDGGTIPPIGGHRPSGWVLEGGRITRESFLLSVEDLFPTTTYRMIGEDDPDFGATDVSNNRAGDVNGDGLRDMVIGMPGLDGSLTAGRTFVLFWNGRDLAGDVALPQDPNDLSIRVVEITGDSPGDKAGQSVDIADVNGDGAGDVLIGAPNASDGGAEAGTIHVVFNPVVDTDVTGLESRPAEGFTIVGENAGDRAGYSISSGGDFNGDGIDDILIGAPGDDAGGAEAGAAYVVFGRADQIVTIDLGNLAGIGFKIVGDGANGEAGRSVSNAGDVNGDGFDDILVGAPGAGSGGRAYVIFGRAGLPGTIDLANLAGNGFRIEAANPLDRLGASLASAGDVNGDGFDDILVGAPAGLTGAARTGAVYLVHGNATTDAIFNSVGDDVLTGGGGDDLIDASLGGDDSANGGAGNDGIYFGASLDEGDRADGGNGDNDQVGLEGNYTGDQRLLLTASMFDRLEVLAVLPGFDYDITTVDGNVPAGGVLTVFAGNLGPDDFFMFDGSAETNGAFRVFGGQGTDIVTTGAGNDAILFGPDKFNPLSDRVDGGSGADDRLVLDGHYTLTLDGTAIRNIDVIALLRGVTGDLADYTLTVANSLVGAGQTLAIEGTGLDTVLTVNGSAEADGNLRLYGGNLADLLTGGGGNDVLDGAGGSDVLAGLGGADTFAFTTAPGAGNVDTISGYSVADDTIQLENAVFAGLAAGALAAGAFNTGPAASEADDRIVYDSVTGALLFDADGSGAGAAVQFALLAPALALGASDFLVI